jgi:hypothetical protein
MATERVDCAFSSPIVDSVLGDECYGVLLLIQLLFTYECSTLDEGGVCATSLIQLRDASP